MIKSSALMNGIAVSRWTLTLAAGIVGALLAFGLGRQIGRAPPAVPGPLLSTTPPSGPPRLPECIARLPLQLSSVAPDEPGAPRREGPGLQLADGQQLQISARGSPQDDQGLIFALDSDGLSHPLWPNSGISAPCPGGCTTLQISVPASTLPPGRSLIVAYLGFHRFELPQIQDGLRNQPPSPLDATPLPMVAGARAASGQIVAHGAEAPSP
jgi:hypothetical protein